MSVVQGGGSEKCFSSFLFAFSVDASIHGAVVSLSLHLHFPAFSTSCLWKLKCVCAGTDSPCSLPGNAYSSNSLTGLKSNIHKPRTGQLSETDFSAPPRCLASTSSPPYRGSIIPLPAYFTVVLIEIEIVLRCFSRIYIPRA